MSGSSRNLGHFDPPFSFPIQFTFPFCPENSIYIQNKGSAVRNGYNFCQPKYNRTHYLKS